MDTIGRHKHGLNNDGYARFLTCSDCLRLQARGEGKPDDCYDQALKEALAARDAGDIRPLLLLGL